MTSSTLFVFFSILFFMFQLTKKKIEEIDVLIKWMECHKNTTMVILVEAERCIDNPKRIYKVVSSTDDNLCFVISKDKETFDILEIGGINTDGRYKNNSLRHIIIRLYNIVVARFEEIMEVNKKLDEAINLFKNDI